MGRECQKELALIFVTGCSLPPCDLSICGSLVPGAAIGTYHISQVRSRFMQTTNQSAAYMSSPLRSLAGSVLFEQEFLVAEDSRLPQPIPPNDLVPLLRWFSPGMNLSLAFLIFLGLTGSVEIWCYFGIGRWDCKNIAFSLVAPVFVVQNVFLL